MATLQEDTRPGVAQADDARVLWAIPTRRAHLLQLLQPLLLPVAAVLLVQEDKEDGAGGKAKQDGQDPPEPDAGLLLPQQAVVIQAAQVVSQALLGGLQLDGGVVQDQLPHPGQHGPHLQHLLRLLDAFGPLPTDVVANHVREGLDRGVELLVHRLQAELCRVQGFQHPDSDAGFFVLGRQVKRGRVGPLVDDLRVVVPGE